MALAVKKCRVCGKEYEACRSANRTTSTFRWQEVACSLECGSEYLKRVISARTESLDMHKTSAPVETEFVSETSDEIE